MRVTMALQAGEITGVMLESGTTVPGRCRGDELCSLFVETRELLAPLARPIDLHAAVGARWSHGRR